MASSGASAVDTVLEFLGRINDHDLSGLVDYLADDHVFIDSLGNVVTGRDAMREGWRRYFELCPDYWVTHEKMLSSGTLVAIFGDAGGTIAARGTLPSRNRWRVSAAWMAVVEHGLIKEWRVYADNKPVYDIIAREATAATAASGPATSTN